MGKPIVDVRTQKVIGDDGDEYEYDGTTNTFSAGKFKFRNDRNSPGVEGFFSGSYTVVDKSAKPERKPEPKTPTVPEKPAIKKHK